MITNVMEVLVLVVFVQITWCLSAENSPKQIPKQDTFCGENTSCLITEYCDEAGSPICLGCSELCLTNSDECKRSCPYVFLFAVGLLQDELTKKIQDFINKNDTCVNTCKTEKDPPYMIIILIILTICLVPSILINIWTSKEKCYAVKRKLCNSENKQLITEEGSNNEVVALGEQRIPAEDIFTENVEEDVKAPAEDSKESGFSSSLQERQSVI
ncbi:DgyrCDS8773 [Dimorphilus gyrociliatus]|uniref:DgyrCDS8773 n=1 Tax=Dimorphilus gyrociliatus TaxID=2664684 RepID=A0A7I8VV46_9ANNE|nr:DgyrCDS8773 [Dimorphilus gyrociliatus]